jgi:hypothetical protein
MHKIIEQNVIASGIFKLMVHHACFIDSTAHSLLPCGGDGINLNIYITKKEKRISNI